MKNRITLLLFMLLIGSGIANAKANGISSYNVVWNSPSESSFGSMPLGNGDIGLNVWVEPQGDLLFYISKVNAFDSEHLLPKLGRIRIKTTPQPSVTNFKQELCLESGAIKVMMGDLEWNIRVDAQTSNVVVEAKSRNQYRSEVVLETIRPLQSDSHSLPSEGTIGIRFDAVEDGIAWAYRNISSRWSERLKRQNTESFAMKVNDPIINRTSGGYILADGFERKDSVTLLQKRASVKAEIIIKVSSTQPDNIYQWLSDTKALKGPDIICHKDYWKAFWNRSFIKVKSCGKDSVDMDQCRYTQYPQGSSAYEGYKKIDPNQNAYQISQRYALERFCEAAAGRGEVPPPYNGSIFTMDMPAGTLGFDATKPDPISPDGRDWAMLSFMWQNTRHPLWSMSTRGDYDCLKPAFQFVRDGLEICKDRCQKTFGHDGAYIMEASWWHNVGVFNPEEVPAHLKYHLLATIELPAIMCEYYEHTQDKEFLHNVLLPCADEFIKFYELQFPERDSKGRYLQEGVGCAETFQGVTNPCTEIGCLKYLLGKLLSFDIDDQRKKHWSELLAIMPEVPLKRIRGRDLLAVGDIYDPGRTNCESPELYSVYPFRQVWLGKQEQLAIARLSHHLRTVSIDGTDDQQGTETGGWQSAPVQAAYLGLAQEAARLVSINFNDQFINWNDNIRLESTDPNRNHREWNKRPRSRFPAFWECKMDGTPDNDHGANSVNTLQSMLLQSDGDKIFLLPAFPENWDVEFKLKAAYNTTIECVYKDGHIEKLSVSPAYRRKDIIDCSTPEYRIKTLIETALSNYNYLYNIPSMLDAKPIVGNATKDWLSRYRFTIEECLPGIFENALFKGDKVYLHLSELPSDGIFLPQIERKLLNYKFVTGEGVVTTLDNGWVIKGKADPFHTIIELTFDSELLSLAMNLPSEGSLTKGKKRVQTKNSRGELTLDIDLGKPLEFDRMEIMIDNPNHLRGEGKSFELQVKIGDEWKSIYKGSVYGYICGKMFQKTKAQNVRLITVASGITQFDLFN